MNTILPQHQVFVSYRIKCLQLSICVNVTQQQSMLCTVSYLGLCICANYLHVPRLLQPSCHLLLGALTLNCLREHVPVNSDCCSLIRKQRPDDSAASNGWLSVITIISETSQH